MSLLTTMGCPIWIGQIFKERFLLPIVIVLRKEASVGSTQLNWLLNCLFQCGWLENSVLKSETFSCENHTNASEVKHFCTLDKSNLYDTMI